MAVSNNVAPAPSAGLAPPASRGGTDGLRAEKLSWYQEVLRIEPGSKIFLSYARLLAESGDNAEAVRVLRAGLENHAEYTEARLFLIHLLHQQGDKVACGAEVARLAGMFREYPAFWDAWSHFTAGEGERRDLSLSLGMLGAMFRDKSVTLADVLSSGLRHIQSPDPLFAAPAGPGRAEAQANPLPHAPAVAEDVAKDVTPNVIQDTAPDISRDENEAQDAASLPDPPPFVFDGNTITVDNSALLAEKCSLRTRSMAELLAEQGDLRSAVEIYEELLASAAPEDAEELEGRLENLKSKLGDAENQPVRPASASSGSSSGSAPLKGGKTPGAVLDILEKLASRLEHKSRQ